MRGRGRPAFVRRPCRAPGCPLAAQGHSHTTLRQTRSVPCHASTNHSPQPLAAPRANPQHEPTNGTMSLLHDGAKEDFHRTFINDARGVPRMHRQNETDMVTRVPTAPRLRVKSSANRVPITGARHTLPSTRAILISAMLKPSLKRDAAPSRDKASARRVPVQRCTRACKVTKSNSDASKLQGPVWLYFEPIRSGAGAVVQCANHATTPQTSM